MTAAIILLALTAPAAPAGEFRPPAVPLVTIDPYTSCWSMNDHLYDDWPRHWTGKVHGMCGLIRVDGKTLRWMGNCPEVRETMKQMSCDVQATRTTYEFEGADVELTVTFTSPLLMDDLDLMSRPVTYVDFVVASKNLGLSPHSVQIYFDASAEWAVNQPDQQVEWRRLEAAGLAAMSIGTTDQKVLATRGDDVRIDWGQLLVAAPKHLSTAIASDKLARSTFVGTGKAAAQDDTEMPRAANDRWPVLSVVLDLRNMGAIRSATDT